MKTLLVIGIILLLISITIFDYFIIGKGLIKATKIKKRDVIIFYLGRNIAEFLMFGCGFYIGATLK